MSSIRPPNIRPDLTNPDASRILIHKWFHFFLIGICIVIKSSKLIITTKALNCSNLKITVCLHQFPPVHLPAFLLEWVVDLSCDLHPNPEEGILFHVCTNPMLQECLLLIALCKSDIFDYN